MRTATILVRPEPEGLRVCACDYVGQIRHGFELGAVLNPMHILLMARQAAAQGARLVLEVQPDGGSLNHCDFGSYDEWASQFGKAV